MNTRRARILGLVLAKTPPVPTVANGPDPFESLMTSLQHAGPLIAAASRPRDRRGTTRYVAQVPIRYRWPDSSAWYEGMTANISSTGVLFALDTSDPRVIRDRPAQPGDPIELTIEVHIDPAGQSSISIHGVARYVRTIQAPGHVLLNATGVAVETWRLNPTSVD